VIRTLATAISLPPARTLSAVRVYPSGRRVLRNKEIARFGEYRTALLILQAWDALEPKELLW